MPYEEKVLQQKGTLRVENMQGISAKAMVSEGCRRGAIVERRTRDQEVVGSILGWAHVVKTFGTFLTPMCICHHQYKLVLA